MRQRAISEVFLYCAFGWSILHPTLKWEIIFFFDFVQTFFQIFLGNSQADWTTQRGRISIRGFAHFSEVTFCQAQCFLPVFADVGIRYSAGTNAKMWCMVKGLWKIFFFGCETSKYHSCLTAEGRCLACMINMPVRRTWQFAPDHAYNSERRCTVLVRKHDGDADGDMATFTVPQLHHQISSTRRTIEKMRPSGVLFSLVSCKAW